MKKFRKKYPIHFFQVGADKRLNLFALMNMIQDIASDHSQVLGFGPEQIEADTHWVLVRQKIQMDYWPQWQEEITIETFISKMDVGTPPRDIRVYHQDKVIGRGQTSWLIVDGKTRKVTSQKVDLFLEAAVEDTSGVKTKKISVPPEGMEPVKTFQVEYSDLDMNLHVNNAIYGQWLTNTFNLDELKTWEIREFGINYLQEILHQDKVHLKRKVIGSENEQEVFIEGRVSEEGKAAFTALLKLVKKV